MGGSGWEDIFLKAGIFQSGVFSSLLGGKHVKRTRYAYELTLVWLEIIRERELMMNISVSLVPICPEMIGRSA